MDKTEELLPVTGEDLLPCPFCGGAGHLQHSTLEIDSGWHVVCHGKKHCPLFCSEPYQVHDDERDAIAAWNTRLQSSARGGEVERLREAAISLRVQAGCLESYAEDEGYSAKPVPSVFHLQASHFRDLADTLSALGSPPASNAAADGARVDAQRTIEILSRALAWHGDPQRMATTREEWQQTIDDAIAWVKANPEPDRPSFSTLSALATHPVEGLTGGWKLVPVEATPLMIQSGIVSHEQCVEDGFGENAMRDAWDAMLAAAPKGSRS